MLGQDFKICYNLNVPSDRCHCSDDVGNKKVDVDVKKLQQLLHLNITVVPVYFSLNVELFNSKHLSWKHLSDPSFSAITTFIFSFKHRKNICSFGLQHYQLLLYIRPINYCANPNAISYFIITHLVYTFLKYWYIKFGKNGYPRISLQYMQADFEGLHLQLLIGKQLSYFEQEYSKFPPQECSLIVHILLIFN